MGKGIKVLLGVFLVLFIGIQFIPVRKTNPERTYSVQWDSEQTKEYFFRACVDCHSHETEWPWYASIQPVAFFITGHVEEGREYFNISVQPGDDERHEAYEMVEAGKMPLSSYLWLHPEAELSQKEKDDFIEGLKNTFGKKEEEKKQQSNTPEENTETEDTENSTRYNADEEESPQRYDVEEEKSATRYK